MKAYAALLAATVVTAVLISLLPDPPPACAAAEASPAAAETPETAPASAPATTDAQPTDAQPTDAPHPDDTPTTALEKWVGKFLDAGIIMWILLGLSILGVALILERAFNLRRKNFVPDGVTGRVTELWREGQWEQIDALCREKPSTLTDVVAFIVRHRDAPVSDVSAAAGDIASADLRRNLQRAYLLAVIAVVSPLLGLLGTVAGMIGAFDAVAVAGEMGDVRILGGHISLALVTTFGGLTVAIPMLFAYHFFRARTNLYGVRLDEEVTELISDCLMKKGGTGDAE